MSEPSRRLEESRVDAGVLLPEHPDPVQQVIRSGRHLLRLINDVLGVSRIEPVRLSLPPKPVSVHAVVRASIDAVIPLAAARDITLAIEDSSDDGSTVLADREPLSRILLNLLCHAVASSRPGGRVSVGHGPYGRSRFRINVLFTPFKRLEAAAVAVDGAGLGLTRLRGMAEGMGGSIGVDSEVGRGSTFWLDLAAIDESDAGALEHAPTVLHIGGNASDAEQIACALQCRPGVRFVKAVRGDEGVAVAAEVQPALIFLDLDLPDLAADEALRQLSCDPLLRSIPVVALAADATVGQMQRILGSGAYLTRPLDVEEVLSTFDRLLATGEGGRQAATARPA